MPVKSTHEDLEQRVRELEDENADLRRRETLLQDRADRYRLFSDNMADIFWTIDRDFRTDYVSPSIEKVLGFTPQERKRQPVEEVMTPESIDRASRFFLKELERENSGSADPDRSVTIDVEYYCKDGSTRWMENNVKAIRDRENAIVGLLGISRDISERKRAEKKLRQSEMLLNRSEKLARIGSYVWDLKDDSLIWSHNMYAIHGLTRGAFPGNPGAARDRMIHPDDRDRVQAEIGKMLAAGNVHDLEFRIVRPDGEVRVMRSGGQFDVNADGQPVTCFGVYQDITEQKQTELELQERTSLFEKVFDILPVGLWLADKHGNILRGNPAGIRIWGGEPRVGQVNYGVFKARRLPSGKEIAPDDWALGHTVNKGVTIKDELLEIDALDGKKKIILNYSAPVLTDKGKIQGAIFVNQDITETKRFEFALKESEAKYRSMMESMNDPVYICSPDFSIEYMNPAMIANIGRNATGESCHRVLHNLEQKCPWCVHATVQKGESVETNIFSPRDRRHYRVSNMPIRQRDGAVSKMTILRDITDYVDALEEKEKARAQLQQAQKMESIGILAGGIAHDFNNILASVIGYTELALDDADPGSMLADHLKEIYLAGKRARDLVRQILAFARQAEEDVKPVQVSRVVKEALKLVRSTIPTTIEIRQQVASDSLVMADPVQIHQIIMNLCTNAAQAMEDGGGVLAAELVDVDYGGRPIRPPGSLKPGIYLKLSISDTGCGMAPETLKSIFDPYFTTKAPGEGTGMGLAMVHGIVKGYGGEISVSSRPGEGSTFTVYLPVTKRRADIQPCDSGELPVGSERILFVDDEAAIARMGAQVLERLGYAVTTRTSSVEALALFRARPKDFDLVITDMTMPHMTGDRLAAEMIRIRPDLSIVLVTGYSKKISQERAARLGIKAFAYKPLVKKDLAKTVRDVLDTGAAVGWAPAGTGHRGE